MQSATGKRHRGAIGGWALQAVGGIGEGMGREFPPEWYETAFGELYPLLYPHRDDAAAARDMADLIQVLGLSGSGARTLDLCCGTGRHAAALSGMGLVLFGLDRSPQLLAEAHGRPALSGRLVRGDMRQLPFAPVFDLVVNLFTSFGYFAEDSANEQALQEMARVLVPGGQLVIDHINRQVIERSLVPEDTWSGQGFRVHQRRRLIGNRIQKEMLVEWGRDQTARLHEDVRLYDPEELRILLGSFGLVACSPCGAFDGSRLTPQSDRMIVVARKPAS